MRMLTPLKTACADSFRLLALTAMVTVVATSVSAAEKELVFHDGYRTWIDSTGNHQVNAALEKYQNRTLTLRLADGKTIEISLDRLSKKDQSYLVGRLRAARREAAAESPPAPPSAPKVDVEQDPNAKQEQGVELVDAQKKPGMEKPARVRAARQARPQRLYGIDWYAAEDASQVATTAGRPMMWFRVLGNLSGHM